jgi:hypothetical protein
MNRVNLSLLIICSVILGMSFAEAQQVPSDPTSSHIFPAGGQRGTKVSVRVGGECLPPMTRFRIFGEGLAAPEFLDKKVPSSGDPSPRRRPGEVHIYYPKEWSHSIDISNQTSVGTYLWRLSCARGGTGGRPFIVGDLPEYIESESNSSLDRAEEIALPITVNGQIDGERDLDYFQFELEKDEVINIEIVSRRLGSPMEPIVEVYDDRDQRVDCNKCRAGSDPVVSMRAPRSGTYRLMIGHLGFHGGPQYVYRATLSTAPYVPFTFPTSVAAGTTATISAYQVSKGDTFDAIPVNVVMPSSDSGPHVGDVSIRGDVATLNRLELTSEKLPIAIEVEPNDGVATSQPVNPAAVINGRFLDAKDVDHFQFDAAKGSRWLIECQRYPRGGDCLPILAVLNADGNLLTTASSVDDPKQPCLINWECPADGKYHVRLRDVQQGVRGGFDFIYRLAIAPAEPGFELNVATDMINVVQGSKAELEVKAKRLGAFNGPIDLQIVGLPPGIRCESTQIPVGQESIKLAFVADEDARSQDVTLRIRGTGNHENQSLTALAKTLHLGRDSDGASVGSPWTDHLQMTVRHKPVLRLFCNEAYQYAYRGSIYPYAMQIERLNGFTGPVHIEIADRQIKDLDGIVVFETTVPEGQTKFDLSLYLPETMHINVQAHSNVYAQAFVSFEDKFGQRLTQAFVSEMRCMIRPLPTVVKLVAVQDKMIAKAGDEVNCRLRLDRTSVFNGPMKIELIEPDVESGIVANPATIDAQQTEASIVVKLPHRLNMAKPIRVQFRATGQLPGYVSIVSEAEVLLMDRMPQQ